MRMVPPAPTSAALDGLGNRGAHVENRNGQGDPSSRLSHFCVPPNPYSSESMLGRLQKEGAGLEELTLHWIWVQAPREVAPCCQVGKWGGG